MLDLRRSILRWSIVVSLGSLSCRAPMVVLPAAPSLPSDDHLPTSTLEAEGMSAAPFVELTRFVRDNPVPVFSILVSRHGKLVYELYAPSVGRDDAHYVMSVTKSVLSALVGVAVDRHLVDPEGSIAALLPRALFPTDADVDRFKAVTLKQAMGMDGVEGTDPPRDTSPEAMARARLFWSAPSRATFVLSLPVLPPDRFQYNDMTPALVGAVLQSAARESSFDFAEETLFRPMGFRNAEWMHQDGAGADSGGYGLRLRPVDMQKIGLLYLRGGVWNGRRLLSEDWVRRSFEPWNRSHADAAKPDYGWFWWARDFGPGFVAHAAIGWKGQRIVVFPEQDVVVTMTGCFENDSDKRLVELLVEKAIMPSVRGEGTPPPTGALASLLEEVHEGPSRFADLIEWRMVPSEARKQRRRRYVGHP
jgi:CubicO group peptidase (beta-lactamase class C family)